MTILYYKFTVTVSTPPPASGDATLMAMSTIKGRGVSSLGTPNATLASAVAGAATLTATQPADISNAGAYMTAFMPTYPGATVTRKVKYASGASHPDLQPMPFTTELPRLRMATSLSSK